MTRCVESRVEVTVVEEVLQKNLRGWSIRPVRART